MKLNIYDILYLSDMFDFIQYTYIMYLRKNLLNLELKKKNKETLEKKKV